jgi:alkylhydroperoxidase/carboxymuconolactone decarboxylase family protein YurZ
MLSENQQKKYTEFYESARNNAILGSKTTLLLHLGTAMAVGCVPCMENYLAAARKEGITEEEIGAVQATVMAVSAGRVSAQLREAERRARKPGGCC